MRPDADPDLDPVPLQAGILRLHFFAGSQDRVRLPVELLSFRSQHQMVVCMGKQRQGKLFFQVPHSDRNGRLRHEQSFRRFGDAVVLGSGAEISQLGKCHRGSSKRFSQSILYEFVPYVLLDLSIPPAERNVHIIINIFYLFANFIKLNYANSGCTMKSQKTHRPVQRDDPQNENQKQ